MPIALDATYSLGDELSGVGVYSREILFGLAAAHPDQRFRFCYRPHRYFRSFRDSLPSNCSRFLLHDRYRTPSRADLFHGLNQRMPAGRLRRSVCTFHDLFVMTGDYSTPEFRERFTVQAQEAAERADVIITVSAFTAAQVESLLGVDRGRLRVVHHGIRTLPAPNLPREPIVLHVGAIQRRKNIKRLVEAFEALPAPWRLVLAGSAGYAAEDALARIEASAARGRIEITGYVTPEQLASLYARASILAFPSLDEGFGMPVLEAMAQGVPVVASNRSALPEVCGDAAVLVDPFSVAEIAGALEVVARDPEARRSLIERGRARVSQFTWQKAVDETWKVYGELLGADA